MANEIGLDAGSTADLQLDILDAVNKIKVKLAPDCGARGVCEGPLPVRDNRLASSSWRVRH